MQTLGPRGTRGRRRGRTGRRRRGTATARAALVALALLVAAATLWRAPASARAATVGFANGGTVEVGADGTVTGTCTISGSWYDPATGVGDLGEVTMPDGSVLPATCYEAHAGVPDALSYGVPRDGTYPFTATRDDDGSYAVLIRSQDAVPIEPYDPDGPVQHGWSWGWRPRLEGTLSLRKASADAALTDGNAAYSLEGAVYGVYADAACTELVATMETGADGTARSGSLAAGDYHVREVEASAGYEVDPTVRRATVVGGGNTELSASALPEEPLHDAAGLAVQKVDAETGEALPQGAASLEGAEYTYRFFAGDRYEEDDEGRVVDADGEVVLEADGSYAGEERAERTWVVRTDADGRAELDAEHLVAEASDELYEHDGSPTLPLGTVVVRETRAPEGYLVSDETYVVRVTQDGGEAATEGDVAVVDGNRFAGDDGGTQEDRVARGDVELTKVGSLDQERLGGVPFMVTSQATGEAHVVVTDENGYLSTAAAWNEHTRDTNANDEAVSGGPGAWEVDEDALDGRAGVWFGAGEPDDGLGALPYDTYVFEELPVSANEGRTLVTFRLTVRRDAHVVDAGTVDDAYLFMQTWATAGDGTKTVGVGERAEIVDAVSYEGLVPGEDYVLHGTLVDAETGEELLDAEGEPCVSETAFTCAQVSGEATVTFELDTTGFAGRRIVVFEELLEADGTPVEEHADPDDEGQTVTVAEPALDSSAAGEAGDVVRWDPEATVTDSVSYEGLNPGEAYVLSGRLVDAETGESVLDAEGEPVEAETRLVPQASSGTAEVPFALDTTALAGRRVVVYERLTTEEGTEVAAHEDLGDEAQTVDVATPAIDTSLTDATDGDREALPSAETVLVDAVSYSGLTPGREYRIRGILMDQASGEPLLAGDREVTAEVAFVPNEAEGQVEVRFAFDAGGVPEGTNAVAFETLLYGEDAAATHTDLGDMDQTVEVTSAPDGTVLDQTGMPMGPVAACVGGTGALGAAVAAWSLRGRRRARGTAR